jgi:hypothetical protein
MLKIRWLETAPSRQFAAELAAFILKDLNSRQAGKEGKFMQKAQKVLVKSAIRVQAFKAQHPLNFYQRSRLANAFLWALKDGGCPTEYADELTEWLTLRL